jgi:lipid A 3-O-deacylase
VRRLLLSILLCASIGVTAKAAESYPEDVETRVDRPSTVAQVGSPSSADISDPVSEYIRYSLLAEASSTETTTASVSRDAGLTVLGITEVLVGVVDHDTGVINTDTEGGVDLTAELRFKPLGGAFFEFLRSPRPHLGFNLNDSGNTSALYTGLTWAWPFGNRYFLGVALGGAVHNGTLETNNREKRRNDNELGCRVLFREAVELGFTFLKRHALSIRFDHLSNANLCDENEGLDTVGLVYGYRF